MNARYPEADNGEAWFGSGLTLPPIYVVENQARLFYQQIQTLCQRPAPGSPEAAI